MHLSILEAFHVLNIPRIIALHAFFGLHGVIWSMTITEVITSVMGLTFFVIFNKKLKKESSTDVLQAI